MSSKNKRSQIDPEYRKCSKIGVYLYRKLSFTIIDDLEQVTVEEEFWWKIATWIFFRDSKIERDRDCHHDHHDHATCINVHSTFSE